MLGLQFFAIEPVMKMNEWSPNLVPVAGVVVVDGLGSGSGAGMHCGFGKHRHGWLLLGFLGGHNLHWGGLHTLNADTRDT